jgi:tetratricopeptide (TPR) repeat protein
MPTQATAEANLKGSVRLGNYLRRLRSGYGYSLRRVEERARAEGGEIDNSQLSRYEKGICYPSFDKLRVLASVFNVSIQAFSDVVDLEAYEALKPEIADPKLLLDEGGAAFRGGELGRAFAYYERALEILLGAPAGEPGREEQIARTRVSLASALGRLGKLALAEQELRQALRIAERVGGTLQAQALLGIANIHADQGDLFLAEIEAERAHAIAAREGLDTVAANALHIAARVMADRRQDAAAIDRYRSALDVYARLGNQDEATRIRINIGGCYVAMGKTREGIRLLKAALAEARALAHPRLEAHAWSSLGEAFYRLGDPKQAQMSLRQSDAICCTENEKYPDLLFFNAFYEWKMAGEAANPTRERIAFGRLKAVRSSLERVFPEVEAFDAFVERGRFDA